MRSLVIALVLAAPAIAAAEPTPVVLAVDGRDVYVDLGGQDGIGAGTELELLHVVVAKDPSTGKTLRDRFAIGTLVVDRAGDHVALARADGALVGRVAPGDQIRLVGELASYRDPWAARVAASRAPAGAPAITPVTPRLAGERRDDAEAVRVAWQGTLGKPIGDRVEGWRAFLIAHPATAYAAAIRAEITSLERQASERDAALAAANQGDQHAARIRALATALGAATSPLAIAAPPRVAPGQPIELAFLVRDPARVGGAVLYARKAGDPGYRRLELRSDGDAYLRGEIPADLVAEPRVEWFAETIGATGAELPAAGSRAAPLTIAVDRGVEEAPIGKGRSRVTLAVDYVDFDGGLASGFDQYVQAELDFMYRFITPIYSFRLGFGTLSGVGGPKDVIDADTTRHCLDETGTYRCRRVAFNYVYTEVEHRFSPTVAVMIRPQAGMVATDLDPTSTGGRCNGSADVRDCEFKTGLGMRGRIRLGAETGTNLVLGVGFTSGVGTLLEAHYHWLPARVVPVDLSVEVSDQPVPENFGVRLIGDVGWRAAGWFYPSLRVSYQARDIDHAGVSGGAAMNFDW